MDRSRYDGYVATRDTVAAEVADPFASQLLCDLAEGLLLARDAAEAEDARDLVTGALAALVDRGDLNRRAAGHFWADVRACGPQMQWPLSWVRTRIAPRSWALGGN
jgi:hypothetical protein